MATIRLEGSEQAAVAAGGGVLPVKRLNELAGTRFPLDLLGIIEAGARDEIAAALARVGDRAAAAALPPGRVSFAPPYRRPRKIWGIGLNYREHADDLKAVQPTDEPASFMKPDTTIIGPGDAILLPPQSQRVTAEAEIAVIIGRPCRDVEESAVPAHVFGYTTVIDMTAEDILQKNPRFLTRAKSFDTFFSFGPWVVTPDEIPDLAAVRVSTVINGAVKATNTVSHMMFPPHMLVAFHSRVMSLLPGDILSTGTPGAAVIRPGDVAEARVDGVGVLTNPVAARPR